MKLRFTLVVLWIVTCVWLSMFVHFYATSTPLGARAWVIPQYAVIVGVLVCCGLVGSARRASS